MSRLNAIVVYIAAIIGFGLAIIVREKFDGVAFIFAVIAVLAAITHHYIGTVKTYDEGLARLDASINENRKEDSNDVDLYSAKG